MLIDRYKESTIQFTAIPRSAMSVSVLKALCTQKHYNDRKAAPALSRPPSIEHESQSMRVRRDGYESEIESDFGKIEFSPQLSSLRPFSFPFHSLLSVSKSHPKGSPCLTTRLTIRPLSRYPSISPLSPFHCVLIGRFLGRFRGLPHLPHAMLGTPQERSCRH